jgi:hypothetical protein
MSAHTVALIAVLAVSLPGVAVAALGEPSTSIDHDQAALKAGRHPAKAHQAYRVERLETAAHTVREYVAPDGTVFAVAWEGVSPPDLNVILGAFAEPYRRALAARRDEASRTSGHRSRRTEAGGAVVETWGHQRALHGRAWVPALLPPGVTPDDIK